MSNSRKAQAAKQGTPKGVTITEKSLDDATPIIVGQVCYMPFPRHYNLTLGRDTDGVIRVDTAKCHPRSFRHASFYKFGGVDGDCVGDAKVYEKNSAGKRVFKRMMTKKERQARMERRYREIEEGTYCGVGKVRGIPIPERLEEAVKVTASLCKLDSSWVTDFYVPFKSRAMTDWDCLIKLGNTLAGHGKNAVVTPDRVAKAIQVIGQKVDAIMSTRTIKWDDEDDDLLDSLTK